MDLIKKSLLTLSFGLVMGCANASPSFGVGSASPESTVDNPYSLSFGVCVNCSEQERKALAVALSANFYTPELCHHSDFRCREKYQKSREYAWSYIIDSKTGESFKYTLEITPTNVKHVINSKSSKFNNRDVMVFSNYHDLIQRQITGHKLFKQEIEAELAGNDAYEVNSLPRNHAKANDEATVNCSNAINNGSSYYSLFLNNNQGINRIIDTYYEYPHLINDKKALIDQISGGINWGITNFSVSKLMGNDIGLTDIELTNGVLYFDTVITTSGKYKLSLDYNGSRDRDGVSLKARFDGISNGMSNFSNPCDAAVATKAILNNQELRSAGFNLPKVKLLDAYNVFPDSSACMNELRTFNSEGHVKVIYISTIRIHPDGTVELYVETHTKVTDTYVTLTTPCA
ncbi:MAG: hypothetical protein VX100_08575 [Pseudomonadota bacterium]|nr:hypothetical protein [Pseudomonadota bacterium]